ncbi:MAG TPA: hypothetical protein PKM41_07275 [Deltaproteobacteria bacterium]|nr:hypothetical protein [Deltaproteobacteria bacterium]HOI06910.1 hypothetical protein [Deltaproteobacteria bacterium]
MTGVQEVLLIVLLFSIIFILPSRLGKGGSGKKPGKLMAALSGKVRLGIFVSAVWLLVWAVYFRPWAGGVLVFALVGPSPVLLGWGIFWVVEGFRKDQDA